MTDALTLFEFWNGGHSPNFLRLILEAWREHGTGSLRIVVTNSLLDQHPSVFEGFDNSPSSSVRWTALEEGEESILEATRAYADNLGPKPKEIANARGGLWMGYWSLVEKYAHKFPSRHVLLMNLDEYLVALGTGQHASVPFSGIFFLPSYYYRAENTDVPFRRRAFDVLQQQLMPRLLNHPQLRVAFFIDPHVAKSFEDRVTAQVTYLKDPVRLPADHATPAEKAATRSRLGVPDDRKLFLFFGDIRGRKGLWKLIEAVGKLTSAEQARMCLAVVGLAEPVVERRLGPQLKALAKSTPLSVIRRAAYVGESELGEWFTAADVVLAPYMRHVGMSGILLLAAAYRRPAISQEFGPMGRLTRENSLGLTVDTRDGAEVARALRSFLGDTSPPGWDADVAYAFAKQQSHVQFGEMLLATLRPFTT
jgi:glycosyltransferase involved in cell wall biosynthesis